jgi:tetratricopeptide (TPR) repeat protein
MPEDNSELFRGRIVVEGEGGLAKAPRPTKPQGLVVNPDLFDLKPDFLDDFADVMPVEPGAVEGRIEPEAFTVVDVDVSALDDALGRIRWQQTDQEVRELIDEARRLLQEGDFSGALNFLQQARDVAPTDGTVLYLIAVCYFFLEDYQTAYDAFSVALEHIVDPETLVAAVVFRGSCLRTIVNEILTKLAELKKRGRFKEALAIVEDNLQRYPSSVTLLYERCELLLKLGLAEQAKRAALEAAERGGEENAPLFRRMFEQATLLEYRPLLEPARQALRVDDAPWATKLLKSAHSSLRGQQFYEAVCAYAREKGRKPAGMISIFSRSREQAAPVADEHLQKLLRWLVAEELDAAHASFDRADYATAITELKRASYIDSRCSHVNYLHGLSLYRAFLVVLNNEDEAVNLERCARDLTEANGYVQQAAAADPALADRSRELSAAIAAYHEQVTQLLGEFARRAEEARPIMELIKKYNNFMDRLEKAPIRTTKDWQSARETMSHFRQRAVALRSSHPEDQGRALLSKLVEALDSNLQGMDKIRSDVEKYSPVQECLIEHNELISELTRSAMTEYQLRSGKIRVQELLNKVARIRSSLGYHASSDSQKDVLLNYLNNWTPETNESALAPTKPLGAEPEVWDLLNKLETSLRDILRALEYARRV